MQLNLIIIFCLFFNNHILSQTCVQAAKDDLKAKKEKKLREIAQVDTSNAFGFSKRGTLKYLNSDFSGAIKDYNKAIEINPKEKYVYYNRGSAKIYLEDYYGAIDDFTKEIKQNSDYAKAYYNRGWVKAQLKKYDEAIKDYDKTLKLDSKFSMALYYRGLSKILKGEKEAGCLDLSKAGENGYKKAYESIKLLCR